MKLLKQNIKKEHDKDLKALRKLINDSIKVKVPTAY